MPDKLIRSTDLHTYYFTNSDGNETPIDYMAPSSIPTFWDAWTKDGVKHLIHYQRVIVRPTSSDL